jgi:hypothetical protein
MGAARLGQQAHPTGAVVKKYDSCRNFYDRGCYPLVTNHFRP